MRKKTLATRLMSVLLSAAVVVASSNGSGLLMDVKAEPVSEENVSVNSAGDSAETEAVETTGPAAEDDSDAPAADETESPKTDETELDAGEESVGDTEDVSGDKAGDNDVIIADSEDIEADKKEEDPDASVTGLVPDATLRAALFSIYNAQAATKLEDEDQFQLKHLLEIKSVDLSKVVGAANITDCTGIGYVSNATTINLSGTAILAIPASEFSGNKALTTIVLPDNLIGIGNSAFYNCTSLTSVQVAEDFDLNLGETGSDTPSSANTLPKTLVDGKVGSNIFNRCTALKTFVLPDLNAGNTTALQAATGLFEGCTGLETVTVSAGVAVIPSRAFYGAGSENEGMTVSFEPNSKLVTIMDKAFQYTNMSKIDLSNCTQLSSIRSEAFSVCKVKVEKDPVMAKIQLAEIKLPSEDTRTYDEKTGTGKMEIGEAAFFMTPLVSMSCRGIVEEGVIDIPNYVTSLGAAAFYGNTKMTTLKLSRNLQAIAAYTFEKCTALNQVEQKTTLGESSVKKIGNAAFRYTENLKDATFLADMTELEVIGEEKATTTGSSVQELNYFKTRESNKEYGSDVFRYSGITAANLPASLRVINSRAFYEASSLANVTWAKDTELEKGAAFEIGTEAFSQCGELYSFTYPATDGKGASFVIGERAFGIITGEKKDDPVITGKLVIFSQYGVPNAEGKNNTLPITLEKLGAEAFLNQVNLPSMSIKNNEKKKAPELGKAAFRKCQALATAELPAALKTVPEEFFYDSSLTQFPTFEGGTNAIQEIGKAAFFGSKIVTLDISHLSELQTIGDFAFAYFNPKDEKEGKADEWPNSTTLTKVIVPNENVADGKTIKWGSGLFYGANKLTELTTKARSDEGRDTDRVYIPTYLSDKNFGANVFSGTAITKAVWGYTEEKTPKNPWSRIPEGMFNATPVADIADACLPKEDLKEIGGWAYSGCPLTSLDLTAYPNLTITGDATFANCFLLETVKLPNNPAYVKTADDMFHVGYFEGVVDAPGAYISSLASVDFGSVQEIGAYAFATCDTIKSDYDLNSDSSELRGWDSSIVELDFTNTKVRNIGTGAFKGNYGLKKVDFTNVEIIGDNSFESCTNLEMTDTPMADSVSSIGSKAFYRDSSLGKVTFGEGLLTIGSSAFAETAEITGPDEDPDIPKGMKLMAEETGLTAVDFSRSPYLYQIGQNAFRDSGLVKFDISGTMVASLEKGALADCPYLTEVSLDEAMKIINVDSISGCVNLNTVQFFSTTVVERKAFSAKGAYGKEPAAGSGDRYTPIADLTFDIAPVELNVGIGRPTKFPYYVNKYEKADPNFGKVNTMIIGYDDESHGAEDLKKYVKVHGGKGSQYYLKKADEDSKITDAEHFAEVPDADNIYTVYGSTKVMTFAIEGLQATPEGERIPFRVINDFKFFSGEVEVSCSLTTDFKLKVMEIPYFPVLYTDRNRTTVMPDITVGTTTGIGRGHRDICLNKRNQSGIINCYYDVFTSVFTNSQPENGNLIIESSNPDVISIAGGAKLVTDSTSKWRVTSDAYSSTKPTVSNITSGKYFQIKPVGCGEATVTLYLEESPNKKTTWTFKVMTEISSLSLSLPTEYSKGFQPGDSFNVLDSVNLYGTNLKKEQKTLSRKNGTLEKLSQYTDNRIVYTSSNPRIATVDANGKVTIKQVTTTKQQVTINASVKNADGTEVKARALTLNVAYPVVNVGAEQTDATGGVIKVTRKASGTNPATATYTKVGSSATSVTIPSTITVNGVVCNVTQIAAGAFKDNKNIKSVTIGNNITKIDKELFKGCSNLQTVTIQGNITEIGESAFEGCTSLKAVSIPKATTKIGKRAFYNCKKMTKVTLSSSAKVTEIGESAFQNCTSLKSITIPYAVTSIGKKAFYNCKKLSKVTISNTKAKLTRIGESAFQNCIVLTKITIPKKVTAIDKKAFSGCKKLKTVSISSSAALLTMGESAFASCAVLTKITIPQKVTSIGSKAFYGCKKLKTITVKSTSLRSIGANAFKGIYKNATITVPKAKKDAYKNLFSGKGQSSKVKIK